MHKGEKQKVTICLSCDKVPGVPLNQDPIVHYIHNSQQNSQKVTISINYHGMQCVLRNGDHGQEIDPYSPFQSRVLS